MRRAILVTASVAYVVVTAVAVIANAAKLPKNFETAVTAAPAVLTLAIQHPCAAAGVVFLVAVPIALWWWAAGMTSKMQALAFKHAPFVMWRRQVLFCQGGHPITLGGIRLLGRNGRRTPLLNATGYVENYKGVRVPFVRNLQPDFPDAEGPTTVKPGEEFDLIARLVSQDRRPETSDISLAEAIRDWSEFTIVFTSDNYRHGREMTLERFLREFSTECAGPFYRSIINQYRKTGVDGTV